MSIELDENMCKRAVKEKIKFSPWFKGISCLLIFIFALEHSGFAQAGSFSRTYAYQPAVEVTHYVGNLFEKKDGQSAEHIYFNGKKILTITKLPSGQKDVAYYHQDHLGGTNVVTDQTGAVKEIVEYDPFGEISRHSTPQININSHYYTGKPKDNESGLYFYETRYYNPKLGRFIQPDTIVPVADDPQSLNRYTYVRNNPLNLVDPTGHSWLQNMIKSINKVFDQFIAWLEDVTNSKWYVEVEVGQSYSFQDAQTFSESTIEFGKELTTQPWQLGVGIARWIYEPRFKIYRQISYGVLGEAQIQDHDSIFINGILNSLNNAFENGERANLYDYFKVAYNPSDGILADLTEAFLQKLFLSSSVDRQLANKLKGHSGIILAGHSQGGIILANTLLNLGLSGERSSVKEAKFFNTQITYSRAMLSARLAGTEHISYSSRYFDFSNALAPNFYEPAKFFSGIAGLYLPLGIGHHGVQ